MDGSWWGGLKWRTFYGDNESNNDESTFATVRLRQRVTKGPGSSAAVSGWVRFCAAGTGTSVPSRTGVAESLVKS